MDGWKDGWMNRWMDGWMNRWMDGWIDGWMVPPCMRQNTQHPIILVDSSNLLALTYDQSPPSMTYNELLQTVTDLSQQRYQAYER